MVPAPDATGFTFLNILYTGIGSAVFWGKAGRSKLRAYALSDLVKWESAWLTRGMPCRV